MSLIKTKMAEHYAKMMGVMRSGLDSYDQENSIAADKHPNDCLCCYCAFVLEVRTIVEDWEASHKTG